MNDQNRCSRQPCPFWRHCLVPLSAMLLVSVLTCEVRSEAPKPADFPELADACSPIGSFVVGNTIRVGKCDTTDAYDPERSCEPFSAESRIVAYEENSHFICATGDASHIFKASQAQSKVTFIRRFIVLKPSIFVVDDVVKLSPSDGSLRWLLHCRNKPTVGDDRICITDGDQDLVCQTLLPAAARRGKARVTGEGEQSVYQCEAEPQSGANEARWLHVVNLRQTGDDGAAVTSVLEDKDGLQELVITTPDRVFRLTLPAPGTAAGHIAIEDANGKTIVSRRPLPGGVLPHGPEGVRLIERWDSRYRDGRTPGWDTGLPAEDLKQAVEKGDIRPCRTAVLGCGSGTNAVYLASKGFDVTAIDVAPTALGIAEAKAKKAGVSVNWVLADVLKLPELEPFDLIFDRGCYHNVRYVDAATFVKSVRQISKPGTRCFVLSLNRDGPPGVREKHMRDDFSASFDFEWLRESRIQTGKDGQNRRASWSLMLRRKDDK